MTGTPDLGDGLGDGFKTRPMRTSEEREWFPEACRTPMARDPAW